MKLFKHMLMNKILDGGDGGTPPPTEGDTSTPPEEFGKGTWYEGVDETIWNDPSMAVFKDEEGKFANGANFIKSYVHAQKNMGRSKMPIPTENSTPDEWRQALHNLGLPESQESYKVEAKEGTEVNPDFLAAFQKVAFETGVLPAHATQMLNWYNEFAGGQMEKQAELAKTEEDNAIATLQKEWGTAWDKKTQEANAALSEFGGKDMVKWLQDSGLDNNVNMIKFMSNIGSAMNEDKIKGVNTSTTGMTRADAEAEIAEIITDFQHPYHNPQHSGHQNALKEMDKLFRYAHPE